MLTYAFSESTDLNFSTPLRLFSLVSTSLLYYFNENAISMKFTELSIKMLVNILLQNCIHINNIIFHTLYYSGMLHNARFLKYISHVNETI